MGPGYHCFGVREISKFYPEMLKRVEETLEHHVVFPRGRWPALQKCPNAPAQGPSTEATVESLNGNRQEA